MTFTLSKIQQKKFLETSGHEYNGESARGRFSTQYPYNNREWELSPWGFSFILDEENGNLICELYHRMTNNRVYGWDQNGNPLSEEIVTKEFSLDTIRIFNSKGQEIT